MKKIAVIFCEGQEDLMKQFNKYKNKDNVLSNDSRRFVEDDEYYYFFYNIYMHDSFTLSYDDYEISDYAYETNSDRLKTVKEIYNLKNKTSFD